jgi:hypothetical protein
VGGKGEERCPSLEGRAPPLAIGWLWAWHYVHLCGGLQQSRLATPGSPHSRLPGVITPGSRDPRESGLPGAGSRDCRLTEVRNLDSLLPGVATPYSRQWRRQTPDSREWCPPTRRSRDSRESDFRESGVGTPGSQRRPFRHPGAATPDSRQSRRQTLDSQEFKLPNPLYPYQSCRNHLNVLQLILSVHCQFALNLKIDLFLQFWIWLRIIRSYSAT